MIALLFLQVLHVAHSLVILAATTVLALDLNMLISMAIGTVLPIVVGLVTTKVTNAGAKAILLALLAAIAGFGTEYVGDPSHFIWTTALLNWLNTFMIAVATHYGLWKPTGVASRAQDSLVKKGS